MVPCLGGTHMLSLGRCREVLSEECDLPDEAIRQIRDQMYDLANVVLDAYAVIQNDSYECCASLLTPDEREAVDERAAILEYEAGLNREHAERLSLHMYLKRKGA